MLTFEEYLKDLGEVGYVERVIHSIVHVAGLPSVKLNEVVMFEDGVTGKVISITEGYIEVLLLTKAEIEVESKVARTNNFLSVRVGESLLGTTIDPLGRAKKSAAKSTKQEELRRVDIEAPGLITRTNVVENFETGVSLVDLATPLGKGQRQLIVGNRKTGKTKFLLQVILAQAKKGTICVYAAIGKRLVDIKDFEKRFAEEKILDQTVIVAATSSDPAGQIYVTPYTAMTIAEYFRDQGKDVLVILDDMSAHAQFYREIMLLANRFPGRNAYPGDIFYTQARIVERAGNFKKGSITCLPVAEIVLGDLSGYIQTNLMAMTDGHIFFDSELLSLGRLPAVNPFLSVTRVGLQAQTPLVRDLSRQLTSFFVRDEKLREFLHFGAELSEAVRKSLDLGDRVQTLFIQDVDEIVPLNVSVYLLAALFSGFWTDAGSDVVRRNIKQVKTAYLTNKNIRTKIDSLVQTANTFNELTKKVKLEGQLEVG